MGLMDKRLLEFLTEPPTRESLSQALELPAPDFLVRLFRFFWDRGNGDANRMLTLFCESMGFYPENGAARYQQTPPELFPFGHPGCDGVHYGLIYYETGTEDGEYLAGQICPMDGDGVYLLGFDSKEAIENLLAFEYRDVTDDNLSPILQDLIRSLDLDVTREKAIQRYDACGNGLPLQPAIPEDWRFVPSSDGVGVLAHRDLFGPEPVFAGSYQLPAQTFFDHARRARESGFLGTALYYLREGFWHNWTKDQWLREFPLEMANVYAELGRPGLAQIISRYPSWCYDQNG